LLARWTVDVQSWVRFSPGYPAAGASQEQGSYHSASFKTIRKPLSMSTFESLQNNIFEALEASFSVRKLNIGICLRNWLSLFLCIPTKTELLMTNEKAA
jgi:hypothetical protein